MNLATLYGLRRGSGEVAGEIGEKVEVSESRRVVGRGRWASQLLPTRPYGDVCIPDSPCTSIYAVFSQEIRDDQAVVRTLGSSASGFRLRGFGSRLAICAFRYFLSFLRVVSMSHGTLLQHCTH